MKLAFVASIMVAALAAFVAVQNAQNARVTFLGWYFEAPLVIVLLIAFVAGAVAAFLALLPASVGKSLEIKRLKAKLPPAGQAGTKPAVPVQDRGPTSFAP